MRKAIVMIAFVALAGHWASIRLAGNDGEDDMAVFMMSEGKESRIQVLAGKPFVLRFQSSPGTGYSWAFAVEPDGKRLAFIEERIEEPRRGLLGGSQWVTWTFRALAAGETEIAMKYARPWETDAEPARTHVFKLTILPGETGGSDGQG